MRTTPTLLELGECGKGHSTRGANLQEVHRRDGRTEYRCAICHRARQRAYHDRARARREQARAEEAA